MTLGADIRELFVEIGTAYTVLRDSGDIEGEFLDYELNSQVSKPFVREHFLEATLQDNTRAVCGDVLRFKVSGDNYLLMNKTPEMFENTVVTNQCVLYKSNVSGSLFRPSGESWDSQTYHKVPVWDTVESNCYALLTESLFGHELETDEEIANIGLTRHELYVPGAVGAQVNDRYEPVPGEYYRLETEKARRYEGVTVFELGEDNR